ncbi:MAG: protein-export chaperone SecB [Desulfobacterales bacterium]|nr:protein-export chaperone SecB [Desulfobacterales bacterium]
MAKNKNSLSPKEYNKNLRSVDLRSITLIDCSVKLKKENFPHNKELSISIKDDIQFDDKLLTEDTIAFYQKYQLTTYEKNKRDFAFKIVAKYEVTFKQEQILSKEFWHIFSGLNLHINTWPYFREFVQNMTQRINVPPLTLQLLKK